MWRRRHGQVTAAPTGKIRPTRFAAVRVSAARADGVIEIDLSSGCIRVRGIVEATMLREVLAATR